LPESFGQLTQLWRLSLYNNKLAALPESLRKLSALEELYLHLNNALGLPPEVLGPTFDEVVHGKKPTHPAEILDYYFRVRVAKRPLNEAKLILVGRGGVGKTSLVNRLLFDRFDLT
jgi:internalin A